MSLVVIDVQERLVPAMSEFDGALDNMVRLIEGFNLLERPVLATEQYPRGLGPTIEPLAGLLPERPDKLAFSCFGCEPFVAALDPSADLVLCGLETHVCVLQTALDGLARGHRVWVAGDAVASRTARCRELALAQLAAAGAVVSATETLLFQLVGEAGNDLFRAVVRLVR